MNRLSVVSSSTFNLGDAIQTEAARRLVPVGCFGGYVDRDFDDRSEWPLLINGWWNHGVRPFVPGSVVLGVHVHRDGLKAFVESIPGDMAIGCRDEHTAEALQSKGRRAYFSGCLTLLLDRPDVPRTNLVCFVDAPDFDPVGGRLWRRVPAEIKADSLHLTHGRYRGHPVTRVNWALKASRKTPADIDADVQDVRRTLELYASCRLVVTGRLHCALPCLAMGTPVLVVEPRFEPERFRGYEDYLNIGRGGLPFDLDWQARPPRSCEPLREALRKTAWELVNGILNR